LSEAAGLAERSMMILMVMKKRRMGYLKWVFDGSQQMKNKLRKGPAKIYAWISRYNIKMFMFL